MVKSHITSQIHYRHKIEIANSRNMKSHKKTKLGVLNQTPWSEISYQEIFKNFENEAVNCKSVFYCI